MIRRYLIRQIGENKGAPRIYIDSPALTEAGFAPGATYSRTVEGDRVILKLNRQGGYKVSKKEVRGNQVPVIDINSRDALSAMDGLSAVRLVIQDGVITALPLASQVNARKRLARLREHVEKGVLTAGSLSHGGGILDHAAHTGLAHGGLQASMAFANEIDVDLLEHASQRNDVWDQGTLGIGAPMQEAVQDEWLMSRLPYVDILSVGIPCSGASKAGASKRGLELMEQHPEVGHLVASFLMVVQKAQPSVVVVECVQEYAKSGSAQIMRQHLRDCGYLVNEVTLNGKEFGVLENRTRWFLVAATAGITVDLNGLAPSCVPVRTVAEVLEPIGPEDSSWRGFDYLKTKALRDEAKGNGFAMQIVGPNATSVPVLRKGYHKGGSTDPLVRHPEDDGRYRLFTAREHARIKQIPERLIEGMSQTKAHELLGQSVLYAPVEALFNRIAGAIKSWATSMRGGETAPMAPSYQLCLATG